MMRLCCLSLSYSVDFGQKLVNDLQFIELCSEMKLDGVDINMGSFQSLEKEHLKKIKRLCVDRGLDIACIGISNKIADLTCASTR